MRPSISRTFSAPILTAFLLLLPRVFLDAAPPAFYENRIGRIALGLVKSSVIGRAGTPWVREELGAETLCWWSDADRAYLEVQLTGKRTVRGVRLGPSLSGWREADRKQCRCQVVRGGRLATGKGLFLGDPKRKVESLYGQPQKVHQGEPFAKENPALGIVSYLYTVDVHHDPSAAYGYSLTIVMEKDRVVEIAISRAE